LLILFWQSPIVDYVFLLRLPLLPPNSDPFSDSWTGIAWKEKKLLPFLRTREVESETLHATLCPDHKQHKILGYKQIFLL
jgi:hypothetical protein